MLVTVLVSVAHAGVWVREPGSAWVEVGVGATVASSAFTERGGRLPLQDPHFVPGNYEQVFEGATTTIGDLRAYGELGVLPELEVAAALPLRWIRSRWDFARGDEALDQQNLGVGDLLLAARWGRTFGPVAVSAGPSLLLPLYDNHPARLGLEPGNQDPYDDQPPLGAGTVELGGHLGVGVGFGRGWAQLEAGVVVRDRRYSSEVPLRLQVGAKPARWIAPFVEGALTASLADGEQTAQYLDRYGKGPSVLDRQQDLRVGGGLLLSPFEGEPDLAPFGLLLRSDTSVWGERTLASTSFGLAVTWER